MSVSVCLFDNDTYNYHISRLKLAVETLDTQINQPTNQNAIKVSKVVKPSNKKQYHKTLGTSVINSPISPPSQLQTTLRHTRDVEKLYWFMTTRR